jgi:hypothetical protein
MNWNCRLRKLSTIGLYLCAVSLLLCAPSDAQAVSNMGAAQQHSPVYSSGSDSAFSEVEIVSLARVQTATATLSTSDNMDNTVATFK